MNGTITAGTLEEHGTVRARFSQVSLQARLGLGLDQGAALSLGEAERRSPSCVLALVQVQRPLRPFWWPF